MLIETCVNKRFTAGLATSIWSACWVLVVIYSAIPATAATNRDAPTSVLDFDDDSRPGCSISDCATLTSRASSIRIILPQDIGFALGETRSLPVVIENNLPQDAEFTLDYASENGWLESAPDSIQIARYGSASVNLVIQAPEWFPPISDDIIIAASTPAIPQAAVETLGVRFMWEENRDIIGDYPNPIFFHYDGVRYFYIGYFPRGLLRYDATTDTYEDIPLVQGLAAEGCVMNDVYFHCGRPLPIIPFTCMAFDMNAGEFRGLDAHPTLSEMQLADLQCDPERNRLWLQGTDSFANRYLTYYDVETDQWTATGLTPIPGSTFLYRENRIYFIDDDIFGFYDIESNAVIELDVLPADRDGAMMGFYDNYVVIAGGRGVYHGRYDDRVFIKDLSVENEWEEYLVRPPMLMKTPHGTMTQNGIFYLFSGQALDRDDLNGEPDYQKNFSWDFSGGIPAPTTPTTTTTTTTMAGDDDAGDDVDFDPNDLDDDEEVTESPRARDNGVGCC